MTTPTNLNSKDKQASEKLEMLVALAEQRARTQRLDYAGALHPDEAFELSQLSPVKIIDVRRPDELAQLGTVPGAKHIVWEGYGEENEQRFLKTLEQTAQPNETILFLCRSGKRSDAAATLASQQGYEKVFNILEGFEGNGQPTSNGSASGWRARGLPTTANS